MCRCLGAFCRCKQNNDKKGKYNERVNVGEELILRQFKSWRGKLLSIMIATLIDLGIKAFGPLHNESVIYHNIHRQF